MERRTPATRESPDAYTTPAVARRGGKAEIVVTGDVSLGTRERVAAAGLPLLEKPLTALRLRAALTRLLQTTGEGRGAGT